MKICIHCNTDKHVSEFGKDARAVSGMLSVCKTCLSEYRKTAAKKYSAYNAKYYKKTAATHKEYMAKWRKENKALKIIHNQNRRAKKLQNGGVLSKGLSARLFILQRGKCPCCGNNLGDDYHLDHIIPIALGGANDDLNMQLLKGICNMSKKAKHPIDFMRERGFLL